VTCVAHSHSVSCAAIVIAGWPGCGKSTLARGLARVLGVVPLERDSFLEPLAAPALRAAGESPGDFTCPFFKQEISPAGYEALESVAASILASGGGHRVALVAPYGRRVGDPEWLPALERRLGAPTCLLWLTAPLEVIRERRGRRGEPRDLAALSDWAREASYIDPGLRPAAPHLHLDSSRLGPEKMLGAAREWLTEWLPDAEAQRRSSPRSCGAS